MNKKVIIVEDDCDTDQVKSKLIFSNQFAKLDYTIIDHYTVLTTFNAKCCNSEYTEVPLIFNTMVVGNVTKSWSYSTYDAAITGHKLACRWLKCHIFNMELDEEMLLFLSQANKLKWDDQFE